MTYDVAVDRGGAAPGIDESLARPNERSRFRQRRLVQRKEWADRHEIASGQRREPSRDIHEHGAFRRRVVEEGDGGAARQILR